MLSLRSHSFFCEIYLHSLSTQFTNESLLCRSVMTYYYFKILNFIASLLMCPKGIMLFQVKIHSNLANI